MKTNCFVSRVTKLWPALILTLVALSQVAYAAYVTGIPTSLTQPDGAIIRCLASGDEYYNWAHDEKGYVIIQDHKTGYWVYAKLVDGQVMASEHVAGRVDPEKAGLTPNVRPTGQTLETRRAAMTGTPADTSPQPTPATTGTINNIVIFIRFSDEAELSDPVSVYENSFNSTEAGANSMKSYFKEASYDALTVNTTFYPATTGSTVISYQDSHPRAYYMPYDATTNPVGYTDAERRAREQQMLAGAVNAVESQIPDELNIDSDGDGNVDGMNFVVNGVATPWATLLWPHMTSLSAQNVYINGKKVDSYTFLLTSWIMPTGSGHVTRGVGTICHEFLHVLGAPDLYHYEETTAPSPVGKWDIMCMDANPPQHPSAYIKYKYLHWIPSLPEISGVGTYTLNPLTSPTGNCYKIASPNSSNEFFLVEYRQKTGTFESQLPGTGMLIYRINSQRFGNAGGPPDEVYVYRPTVSDYLLSNAYFSSESGRIEFNGSTNPACTLTDGRPGGICIGNVGSAGDTISFDVIEQLPTPTISVASGTCFGPVTATLTCPLGIGEIHYTLDGSDPDASDPCVSSGGSVVVKQSATLKARSYHATYVPSNIQSATYTIFDMSISEVKLKSDGTQVGVHAGVVIRVAANEFDIESDNRCSGIHVSAYNHTLKVGMRANVLGKVWGSESSRYISATFVEQDGEGTVEPLLMNINAIGGGDWMYDATAKWGQLGFPGASGLNNVGLLVRTTGKMFMGSGSTFQIRQGTPQTLTCVLPTGMTPNYDWGHVTVTGVVSRFVSGTSIYPRLMLRDLSDVRMSGGSTVKGRVTSVIRAAVSVATQSLHPYAPDTVKTYYVYGSMYNTTKMRVHFTQLQLESGADKLRLCDSKDNLIQEFDSSTLLTDFWSEWVPGNSIRMYLTSNGSVENYGFQIDKYERVDISTPRPGVTLTVSPGGQRATTNSSGYYTVQGVGSGEHTITPSAAGATLDPASKTFTTSGEEVISGLDFVWL